MSRDKAGDSSRQTRTAARQGPAPLMFHLMQEHSFWQLCLAGLMASTPGCLPSKQPSAQASNPQAPDQQPKNPQQNGRRPNPDPAPNPLAENPLARPLQNLLRENPPDPDAPLEDNLRTLLADPAFHRQVHAALFDRLDHMLDGISAYRTGPAYTPFAHTEDTGWARGTARLRRVPGGEGRPPVLMVPSLVNRAYVLDLLPEHSLAGTVAAGGFDVWLLDWNQPREEEAAYGLGDYVSRVLMPAITHVAGTSGQGVHLLGYCLGGTLATGAACVAARRQPEDLASLTLLATPWAFRAIAATQRDLLSRMTPLIRQQALDNGRVHGAVMQMFFASLDIALNGRKFSKLGRSLRAWGGDPPQGFLALEDWVNDPVDLAGPAALDCLEALYGRDLAAKGNWEVDGIAIHPEELNLPTQIFVPTRDRIVPPEAAHPLARAISGADVADVPLGHVGLVTSGAARARVHQPLVDWLVKTS